ncbi:MAG: hypothetical protein RLZZ403_1291 [Pseudomonadota bacterium]|jgi:hypothetical protein
MRPTSFASPLNWMREFWSPMHRAGNRGIIESAVVDTVEIPVLNERQLTGLKTGHRDSIAYDELGNAVWQFAPDEAGAPGSAEQPNRTLEHPALSIVDDDPPDSPAIRKNVKGLRTGYNPYDSGQLAGKVTRKPRDMRELSKWIELRKKLESGK